MASSSKAKSFSAETKFVKELTAILDESNLTELEFESEDISVRLARGTTIAAAPAMMAATAPAPAPVAAAPAESAAAAAPGDAAAHPGAVKSPMVGTVYLAPEPDAPLFAKEGDQVKKGQTLFIVEAMKVMNPITAPADGKLTRILVDNAQPIEFDQPLAIIE
ncbi:MAG: acetyl-CoA carboxylase biotin carboxyl carrier protein [Candidatus Puniceispirillaceae bacterium]|jgi:acetyl-CoA carboxylase biotin carboxyl carrier protein